MSHNNIGMGWLRDYPDFRDFTIKQNEVSSKVHQLGQTESIQSMLAKVGDSKISNQSLPTSVEEDEVWKFIKVEDQGYIGSCTAQACVGLVEYFERKAFGKHRDASRSFLYKVTRNLLHLTGDTGAYLRSTMAALALFGILPEEYWPYTNDFDEEPPAFCYSLAQNFQTIQYYRLDPPGYSPENLLERIKRQLVQGLPSVFGFTLYASINQSYAGEIPYPVIQKEQIVGGHAVIAIGYDDSKVIENKLPGGQAFTGALRIRNSWGESWGDGGYGWLPYEYVLSGLAVDWWSLLKSEWIDTGNFGL